MLIDAHGHYTTVPAGLRVFRALQISQMEAVEEGVTISDDEIRASLEEGAVEADGRARDRSGPVLADGIGDEGITSEARSSAATGPRSTTT